MFSTNYKPQHQAAQKFYRPSEGDFAGYVDKSSLIQTMQLAGLQNQLARSGAYDLEPGADDPGLPPRDYTTAELDMLQAVVDLKHKGEIRKAELKAQREYTAAQNKLKKEAMNATPSPIVTDDSIAVQASSTPGAS